MCTNVALHPETAADLATAALPPEAEAFASKLMDTLNGGAACLMISIGHRTGLFDALADGLPVSSQVLAEKAGLNERYVREWLGAMAVAGVVDLVVEGVYRLPPERAMLLTRDAASNMAAVFQFVAELGGVESRVVDCFRYGGGVPYAAFDRFHEIMADESDMTVVAGLIDHVLPLAPGLTDRLQAGIDVVDIGCGCGRALNHLARAFPDSRFAGYDLCEETIARARSEAREAGLTNVTFKVADAAIPVADRFDLAFTFDAVHDQGQPARVLANIRAMLRPGGMYICQELDAQTAVAGNLDHQFGTWLYTISTMHCMTVSLAQGGAGLGAAWGEQMATEYLRDAGFADITANRLPHDIQNIWFVAKV